MARPTKTGLDYFPMDVHEDEKLLLLEVEYGLEGHMIFLKILKMIYAENYYLEWNYRKQKLLSHRINVDNNHLSCVINECINLGLFNKNLYETYGILTSSGIQKRFFKAIDRRIKINVDRNYLLVDVSAYINPEKTELMYTETPLMSAESTQSKVKKSKVKESKEKNSSSVAQNEDSSKNPTSRIQPHIDRWNELSKKHPLPRYRYLEVNLSQTEGIGKTLGFFEPDEIAKAMENYALIVSSPTEYTAKPVYSGLEGFLKSGVEKYTDDAHPFERCKIVTFDAINREAEKRREAEIDEQLSREPGFDDFEEDDDDDF